VTTQIGTNGAKPTNSSTATQSALNTGVISATRRDTQSETEFSSKNNQLKSNVWQFWPDNNARMSADTSGSSDKPFIPRRARSNQDPESFYKGHQLYITVFQDEFDRVELSEERKQYAQRNAARRKLPLERVIAELRLFLAAQRKYNRLEAENQLPLPPPPDCELVTAVSTPSHTAALEVAYGGLLEPLDERTQLENIQGTRQQTIVWKN